MQIFHIIRLRDAIWKSEHHIRFLFVCLYVCVFLPSNINRPSPDILSLSRVFPILHGLYESVHVNNHCHAEEYYILTTCWSNNSKDLRTNTTRYFTLSIIQL